MIILRSIGFFILAGACEIIGGYLVWKVLKDNHPFYLAILGAILLAVYGGIATLQPAGFGRTYAAYGGVFIVMSLFWAWLAEKTKPDFYDIAGAIIVLTGVAIIFYAPRN